MKRAIWIFCLLLIIVVFNSSCIVKRDISVISNSENDEQESFERKKNYYYAFHEATKQRIFGNYQNAQSLYKNCINVRPESHASYYQLSKIFLWNGNMAKALNYAIKAYSLDSTNFWYALNVADIYSYLGNEDKVIGVYESIIENYPDHKEIQFELIKLYFGSEQYEKCINKCNQLEDRYGMSPLFNYYRSMCFEGLEKYELARSELAELRKLFPNDISYLLQIGEIYRKEGATDKAISLYDSVIKANPDNSIAKQALAELYYKTNDLDKTKALFKDIVQDTSVNVNRKVSLMYNIMTDSIQLDSVFATKLLKDLSSIHHESVKVKLLLTDYYLRVDSFSAASENIRYIIRNEDVSYYLYEQLFYVESNLKQYDTLIRYASEAINKYPDRAKSYLFQGIGYLRIKSFNASLQSLQKGLVLADSNNPSMMNQLYTYLGECYYYLSEFEKAYNAFEEALSYNPDDTYVLNNYSYYLSIQKDHLEKAKSLSYKTLELDPDNYVYLDTYGWILYQLGEYKQAVTYLERAVANGGNENGEVLEHLGDAYFKIGEKAKAVKYWKMATKYEGSSENILNKIKKEKILD
jgi:tetratricopeptide (TPR) repeat protein